MTPLVRHLAPTLGLIAAITSIDFVVGCGEKPKAGPTVAGPVEGRKFVVGDQPAPAATAPAVSPPDVATPASGGKEPVPAATAPTDSRKKRDQWRDAKLAGEDPGIGYTGATPVKGPSPATPSDPAKPATPTPPSTSPAAASTPAATASDSPAPFVDPNNPNFVPADRKAAAQFDPKSLKEIEGHLDVPFTVLAGFEFTGMVGAAGVKDEKGEKHTIPDNIKALDGKKVVITGYMMPIDFEDGGTNEFVLTRVIPSCFYCQPPQLNDWVEVKIKDGKRVPYVPDGPVNAFGTIQIGEVVEDGFVVALYRMTATKAPLAPQH
jgi:hypothetical protein